jgi:WD40 repeat protein
VLCELRHFTSVFVLFFPEMKVTSLCWRPDGKALAVGHDDGSIAIHDVEVRLFFFLKFEAIMMKF